MSSSARPPFKLLTTIGLVMALQMSLEIQIWLIFREGSPPNTVLAPWFILFPHKCFLMCPPFLLSMSLIPLYAWPAVECLLFFSVVIIGLHALKVFCIGVHVRREKFFIKLLVFTISDSWHVKSMSKDSSLMVQKDLVYVGIIGK